MKNRVDIHKLPDSILLINVYLSQLILFAIGLLILLLFQQRELGDLQLWSKPFAVEFVLWGSGFAACVLLLDVILYTFVPKKLLDDGGVNDKLFIRRPAWHIGIICVIVAVCEEFLFRGVIQHSIGLYWTSILFALIHWRYLKKWLLTVVVFLISLGLGLIYIKSGSLWTPIIAHFLIDFILGCYIHWKGGERAS